MILLHNVGVNARITDDILISLSISYRNNPGEPFRVIIRPSGFVGLQRRTRSYWENTTRWRSSNIYNSWLTRREREREREIAQGREILAQENIPIIRLAR